MEIKLGPISSDFHTLTERRFYRQVASICKHQVYPSCRPSTKPPSPRLWADLCIPLLRSSERILIWCSCGTKAEFLGLGGKRDLFKFKSAVNLINLNILDKPLKILWHKGSDDIREVFTIIKFPTWSWWPLLIQILPVVKVVTAAFHIKNVARNHVNSSILQRLPTVKLVWWHFLGLNNNDNTNNSVNSKNIYTLLLSIPKSFHFAHQTDHIHTFLVTGIFVF